jgi:hypothetical protein
LYGRAGKLKKSIYWISEVNKDIQLEEEFEKIWVEAKTKIWSDSKI